MAPAEHTWAQSQGKPAPFLGPQRGREESKPVPGSLRLLWPVTAETAVSCNIKSLCHRSGDQKSRVTLRAGSCPIAPSTHLLLFCSHISLCLLFQGRL